MLNSLILLAWVVLGLSIVYSDCTKRNVYNYQVFIAFVLSVMGSYKFGYELNFIAFITSFFIGFILWKANIIGAGDIKLIMSVIICYSIDKISLFFMLMSVIGLMITIIIICIKSKQGVPYAPAIIISHLLIFYNLFY